MRNIAGLYVSTVVMSYVGWTLIIDAVQRFVFQEGGVCIGNEAHFRKDSK